MELALWFHFQHAVSRVEILILSIRYCLTQLFLPFAYFLTVILFVHFECSDEGYR